MSEPEIEPQNYVGYRRDLTRGDSELHLLRECRKVRHLACWTLLAAMAYGVERAFHPSGWPVFVTIIGISVCTLAALGVLAYAVKKLPAPRHWKKATPYWAGLAWMVALPVGLFRLNSGTLILYLAGLAAIFQLNSHIEQELRKLGYRPPGWFGMDRFIASAIRTREANLALEAPSVPENLYSGEPPRA